MHSISPLLSTLASTIVSEHHPSLEPLNVAYLFQTEAEIRNGKVVPGRTHRATDRDFALHGYDFVVTIAKDAWDELKPEHQYALLDHFISFMGLRHEKVGGNWRAATDPTTGRLRSYVKEPDVKEFEEVIARHGTYTVEIQSMFRAFVERRTEEKAAKKKDKKKAAPDPAEADVSGDAEAGEDDAPHFGDGTTAHV